MKYKKTFIIIFVLLFIILYSVSRAKEKWRALTDADGGFCVFSGLKGEKE